MLFIRVAFLVARACVAACRQLCVCMDGLVHWRIAVGASGCGGLLGLCTSVHVSASFACVTVSRIHVWVVVRVRVMLSTMDVCGLAVWVRVPQYWQPLLCAAGGAERERGRHHCGSHSVSAVGHLAFCVGMLATTTQLDTLCGFTGSPTAEPPHAPRPAPHSACVCDLHRVAREAEECLCVRRPEQDRAGREDPPRAALLLQGTEYYTNDFQQYLSLEMGKIDMLVLRGAKKKRVKEYAQLMGMSFNDAVERKKGIMYLF
ncbi:hypothetical protein JB92DRAFT_2826376 [Gautieria morchelliformis]|nr:hypothetical protein JB92DRAFT_2826376 [Gautieria morchelliformis]